MQWVDALRQHAAGQAATLLHTLRDWPWFGTLQTLRRRFREDHLGLSASSLTFTTMLALVPLLTVMLALFTAFPIFAKFQVALQQYFLQALVPDTIARPVLGALTQFASKANRLGSVGLVVLLFSALALMLTIDRTLNGIWRVRRPRRLAQRLLVYWAALTLGPLLLGMSLSLTSYALSASRGVVDRLPGGVGLLLEAVQFALLVFAVAGLFRFVPNTHVRWRHAFAGALFTGVGFEAAKSGLALYLSAVPGLSVIYGAFATLPILLLWVYLSWVVVLLGAVIAAYAPSLQMHIEPGDDRPGQPFELALGVLRELHAARALAGRGLTLEQLGERLRTDPLRIEAEIEALIALGWVGRLDDDGPQRHVLLCEPASTPAAPLIERLLLTPAPATQAFRRRTALDTLNVAELIGS
ncbi:MAG: YihY family inner membrane protein [Burkholderiales bacterium]|nr:YihY family inner membrane protein [Burkholderiales bacterium]